MLAPTSMITIGPWCDGKIAAMPGRRTPGRNILAFKSAEATIAPVLPADTTALTSPAAINPQQREIELSRFFLRASTGFSSMPITWLACTIGKRFARRIGRLRKLGLDSLAVADQHDGQIWMVVDRLACSRDDGTGSKIAPHRVQGYAHGLSHNSMTLIRLWIHVGPNEIGAWDPAGDRFGHPEATRPFIGRAAARPVAVTSLMKSLCD